MCGAGGEEAEDRTKQNYKSSLAFHPFVVYKIIFLVLSFSADSPAASTSTQPQHTDSQSASGYVIYYCPSQNPTDMEVERGLSLRNL